MNILCYVFIAIFAAAMFAGSFIACGRDGEKENIVKYNNMEDWKK
jgi:hypothetical protein